MTEREGFKAVLHFEKPDRVPNVEIGYWEETFARWQTEGLPLNIPSHPSPGDKRYTRHSRELTQYFQLDAEVAKITPLMERGGYLPTIDHKVPLEVSLEPYRYYL